MLLHPLIEKLRELRLPGMLKTLEEQLDQADINQLSFEERLGLMIEREVSMRENRRLQTRLKKAKLKLSAAIEDIDYHGDRKLDRSFMLQLSQCEWIKQHRNILITGATGTGKTYLACALAHKACLEGFSTRYYRLPRLFDELTLTRADGRYLKLLREFEKTDVLILDDWGIAKLNQEQRRDLLEIIDDRHSSKSTIFTSQLPVKLWHDVIGDKTLGDAILDRLIHNAYRLALSGETMRKRKGINEEKK